MGHKGKSIIMPHTENGLYWFLSARMRLWLGSQWSDERWWDQGYMIRRVLLNETPLAEFYQNPPVLRVIHANPSIPHTPVYGYHRSHSELHCSASGGRAPDRKV